jgi:hypothetical protein
MPDDINTLTRINREQFTLYQILLILTSFHKKNTTHFPGQIPHFMENTSAFYIHKRGQKGSNVSGTSLAGVVGYEVTKIVLNNIGVTQADQHRIMTIHYIYIQNLNKYVQVWFDCSGPVLDILHIFTITIVHAF